MKKQNKKSMLNQVMTPGDWVRLTIVLMVFTFSWFLVWKTYTAPVDSEIQIFYSQKSQ